MWSTTAVVLITASVAAVSGVMAFILVKIFDRLRRRDAISEAATIIAKAKEEAENRRREAELEIKELASQAAGRERKGAPQGSRRTARTRAAAWTSGKTPWKNRPSWSASRRRWSRATQRKLTERIQDVNRRKDELAKLLDLQRQTLHELSGLSQDEATRRLLEMLDTQLQQETGAVILATRSSWRKSASRRPARSCSPRSSATRPPHTAEITTSTVGIPNDEMKGRIIGREGRNIRAFEKATGVDVIIDDTPGVVIVSGFDMVRREVARLALDKLIADGRIHPARIEEIVAGTQKELERHIQKLGEEACQEAGDPRPARAAGRTCWAGCTSAPATARTCCGTASKWPSSPA